MDFEAIKKRNAEKTMLAELNRKLKIDKKVKEPKVPSYLSKINHLLANHLAELSSWEEDFLYETLTYLKTVEEEKQHEDFVLSGPVKAKINEIQSQYCTQMCHALDQAGVPHG